MDYNSAYKKVNLDSVAYGNFHSQRATFAECLRVCQVDEGNIQNNSLKTVRDETNGIYNILYILYVFIS